MKSVHGELDGGNRSSMRELPFSIALAIEILPQRRERAGVVLYINAARRHV